ncbi:regulating synaptic membrane exocytosis protein 2 isoform X3 [Cardiocondyla obscurior]|uniref:regulating synaptic membrane exocytosis protein 2 isoform X3 n=1 Tax=Cardiocondyla obscurior TaxID=286306 RepID=UPI0039657CE8
MAELPQTPDMSHLTPEERRIIEGVLMRQKEEEEQDHEIMRRKQDEVQILEETIRMRSEKHKKAGIELNATCHICLKTKFADGVGHICNYCDIRCCARCGGKVTLRSSKVIWVCILCRKKQELLSKTGQWMTKTGLGAVDSALVRQMQEDLQVGGHQGLADQTRDKRPKLERAHSAAEKENLPLLQRSGNCPLRRQYSQQEQISGRRMSTSDSGVEMSVSPHARTLPTPHVVSSYPVQQTPRHPAVYPDDDPNLYRGELDGLMRQHPPNYQRQRSFQDQDPDIGMTYSQTPIEIGSIRAAVHPSQQHSLHQTQVGRPVQSVSTVSVTQQRSFSSSEEERSTPECASDEPDESEKGKGYYPHAGGPKSMSSGGCRHNRSHNGHHVSEVDMTAVDHNGHHPSREPRKEESTLVRRSFRRCGGDWRTDSRRFTERREKKTVRFDGGTNVGDPQEDEWSWEADRQGSQDSATKDSGIDTSSTFTSSEDSNRGDLPKHPLSWQVSEDGQKIIGHMVLRKSAGSGSCSSILGLKVVGGKLLEDGSMGALIEKVKKGSTADVEGQLRPGDEVIAWNGRSLQGKSFREVYNIIAESRLEPQIELVVERKLSSTTTGMTPAGPGPSTPMASRRIVAQSQWKQKHETISGPPTPHHKGLKKCLLWELYDARREKPSVLVTSPGSPDLHAQGRGRHSRHPTGNANVGGSIQVKLGFDPVGLQLIVTIICAAGLTPKSNGQPRNPYAKVFLLPDKSEKSKRRTKTVANTNDPRWNQSFVYNGVRRSELRKRALEISVWDYARYEANDFLGEAVLELAVCPLDEEPEWHSLTAHGEHRHVRHYQDSDDVMDCHLSPPSTTSRLSDSDTSECDITDCDVSREQRRTADGASISSIGSSSRFHNMPSNYKRHYSSPPPERELCIDGEHRSRRDMSPQGRKRAALMISRDQPASIGSSYQTYRKDEIHRGMMGHRSHSAAPMDSSSVRYRGRSQSPTGHRSLSPPEHRSIPFSHAYVHTTRFGSRSATATPTGSPKKRQLPQIPAALKERVAQDFEERARFMRHRNRPSIYRSTGMGGWERHYSGLSDSDLPSIGHDPLSLSHSHAHRLHRPRRGHLSPDKDVLGDLGDSDMESIVSVTSSAFSTQSERPRGSRLIEYTSQSSSYEKTSSRRQVTDNGHDDKRSQFTRSLSNADVPQDEKDAARRGRKSSPGSKSGSGSSSGSAVQYQGGLSKKSNSTSQLSATECGGAIIGIGGSAGAVARCAGLTSRKRNSTPSSIQRSEEIMPVYQRFDSKQAGSAADIAGSLNSISSSEGSSWSPSLRMAGDEQLRDFIADFGPGQVVGRQALGARCLGEIQLSLSTTKGYLEVEVIRAKDLKAKQGSKIIPAPYVKLYLVNGKRCIEKAKTTTARKTLDPFYQQVLTFKEDCKGCILQVTVWGDYGRIEGKKVFMGIAQIELKQLELSHIVFGWYKLFDTQSLVSGAPSLALSRRSSVTSLDSFKT